MDNTAMFPRTELAARELMRKAFLDDNIDSETYCQIAELHSMIVQLNTPRKSFIKRLFRK